jgi:hypothetical protein
MAAHVASAQPQSERSGKVSGFVRDTSGGGTLTSAVVAIESSGTRTETQADGSFTLFVPPGRYVLTASYTGLEKPRRRSTSRPAGRWCRTSISGLRR